MFGLAPHPHLKHPVRGSPRMFKIDWIERYFSRVKPIHVLVMWLPIIAYTAFLALSRGASSLAFVGAWFGGVFLWTLLEYLLHRFVFHFEPHGAVQEDLAFLIHGIHHDYPWDADRLVMPPFIAALFGAVIWFGISAVVAAPFSFAVFSGVAAGYVWYDLSHYAQHHLKPRTRVGRFLRSYHFVHHFKTPNLRYGVSTPLWDYVFGTAPQGKEATIDPELPSPHAR